MIKIRPARSGDLKDAVKLSEAVFKSSFLKDLNMRESSFKPSNIRLLFEGGRLASSVAVIPRDMYMNGAFLKMAGIGGVATYPEFRGKGYANLLMKDAVSFMEKQGYGLSTLYLFNEKYCSHKKAGILGF